MRKATIDHSIYKSVIRVRKRLTYTTVSKIIVDKDEETIREHADLVPMLDLMHDLSRKLRAQRIKEGAVDFDLPETKIVLDENNRPTSVQRAVRDDANQLIEEFMLVANRTVAERLYWMNVPSLYRVHEEPSEEKLSNLKLFLSAIGYRMKKTKSLHPKVFQNILKNFAGRAEEYVVDILLLRSLKLAKYSPENKGHFGLAFDFYTHFTAPIRRYPDLVVHRILKATLDGELTQEYVEDLEKELTEIADHCSEQERLAENAERESEKLMKAEYMVDRIGMEFDGIISGVTSFGIFVMLENTVEGLVSVANLPDDYYEYVSTQYALIGERTRKRYRIGDRVRVQVIGVKPDKGEVDFMLAGVERDVREKTVITNRRAHYDYFIEDTFEAGIVLKGTEVKSLRAGKGNLQDAYATIEHGEVYLNNMHISPYEQGNRYNHDPLRPRKLLLHKQEIRKLIGKVKERGYTLVPLRVYFSRGLAEVELAMAKGKRQYDKRQDMAKRDAAREVERVVQDRERGSFL